MIIPESIEEWNSFLLNFHPSHAKIWQFDKTLSRLVIRLWHFDYQSNKVREEVFIACLACSFISGPFSWENPKLKINIVGSDDNVKYKLIDLSSNFNLVFSGGMVLLNPSDMMS